MKHRNTHCICLQRRAWLRLPLLPALLLLCALALCGCKRAEPMPVGGDYAGLSIEEAALREAAARGIALSDAEEAEATAAAGLDLDELTKLGELGDATLDTLLASQRAERICAKLRAEIVTDVRITDQEAQDWYDARFAALKSAFAQNAGIFQSQQDMYDLYGGVPPLIVPEGYVRFHHILVEERALAENISGRLGSGEDFFALLDEFGTDAGMRAEPYRTLGYLTGPYTATRDFIAELKTAALSLAEPGEISGVVESASGFHIVRLSERLPAGELSFAETRESIKALLQAYQEQARFEEILNEWTKAK